MQNYRAGDKICLFGVWALRSFLPSQRVQRGLTNLIAALYCL